jgi:peptidoglycan hydrolase-like protein with peptidoglycan-binding domain
MARRLVRVTRACVAVAAMAVLLVPASADAQTTSTYAKRTLTVGSQGSDVKLFQKYLLKSGFPTRASGYYGSATKKAEQQFERELGSKVDGKASPRDQKLARTVAQNGGDPNSLGQGSGGQGYDAASGNPTEKATISSDGKTAVAPDSAPQEIKDVIAAANEITSKPYKYGGGHGSWDDDGYDCSGSVSYALHGADLVDKPLDSTGFESWGAAGKGQWITVYANSGHAYAVIAGLRFDTSGDADGETGPRWHSDSRSGSGYTIRHPDGL